MLESVGNTATTTSMDVSLERDTISVSQLGSAYRRVEFHSPREFEIFLEMELRKKIRLATATNRQQP